MKFSQSRIAENRTGAAWARWLASLLMPLAAAVASAEAAPRQAPDHLEAELFTEVREVAP